MKKNMENCLFISHNEDIFLYFHSQDEKKRRQFGDRSQRQKIVLEAVLDTTCKKCGGKGKTTTTVFVTISNWEYMESSFYLYLNSYGVFFGFVC